MDKNFPKQLQSMSPTSLKQKSFFGPFLKNKVPTLLKQPPKFFFQEAHNFDSKTSTRPTYDVSCKAVPKGIRDKECERFTLQECPPVPYVPEKDPI